MTKPWDGEQWLEEEKIIEEGFKDDTDLVAMRMYYAGVYIALERLKRALRIDCAGNEPIKTMEPSSAYEEISIHGKLGSSGQVINSKQMQMGVVCGIE